METVTINEFLQKYRKEIDGGYCYARPRVKCADGFTISVQAGKGLYSNPRVDADFYSEVELGFPSCEDPLIRPYAEDWKAPCKTVYAYVPVYLVDELLQKHGGIAGADFKNTKGNIWT